MLARGLLTALLGATVCVALVAQRPRPRDVWVAPQAQAESRGTPGVFQRFSDHVVKIQVVEQGSGAKSGLGSGFYVSSDGYLVTNYHVVARVIHEPGRYRAELVVGREAPRAVEVLAVDVVNDLAVLRTDVRPTGHFRLAPLGIAQGLRLYSLGHPADLGLAIVEGTYNGPLRHTLHERIHFTGSLNPGMSGGPAITARGEVVGVNVASGGNQLGFLVPVERAVALLARARAPGYRPPAEFLDEVGRQLRDYQEKYLASLFADSVPTIKLGSYRVPTQPAPFFDCWADAERDREDPYQLVDHECTTNDYVYVSSQQASGIVHVHHRLLTSTDLGRFRFAALYTDKFREHEMIPPASREEVTPFRCRTGNVRQGGLILKTLFCVRRYRKFPGLYDAVVRAAALGRTQEGLVTTLTLAGVSFDNARVLARRYLGSMAWTE